MNSCHRCLSRFL